MTGRGPLPELCLAVAHLLCLLLRCPLLPDNQGTPIKLENSSVGPAFEGDKFRPELETINASVKDTQGRAYPGNPLRSRSEVLAKCYSTEEVHLIRITDSCPCTQVGFQWRELSQGCAVQHGMCCTWHLLYSQR